MYHVKVYINFSQWRYHGWNNCSCPPSPPHTWLSSAIIHCHLSLPIWFLHCHLHDPAGDHTTAAAAKALQSCPTLCNPIDSSPPGSPIPGILQARTLEWVAISFSNAWKWKVKVKVKSLSHIRLLATPWTACSLPSSSVHGIFQARVLEWGAIAFSWWSQWEYGTSCHASTWALTSVLLFFYCLEREW